MATNINFNFVIFVLIQWFYFTASKDIRTTVGSTATFHLPSFKACGQYNLTNYNQVNVIRVLGKTRTEINVAYKSRSRATVLNNGTVAFTLNHVTCDDEGTYECTSQRQELPRCAKYFSLSLNREACMAFWESWMSWSSCDTTCGPGTRERIRHCSRQGGCKSGRYRDEEACANNPTCTQYEWGMWNPWGPCSSSCDTGYHYRGRMCLDRQRRNVPKNNCPGAESQKKACRIQACVEALSDWATWSAWSRCSVTCDEGSTRRTRACQTRNGLSCEGEDLQTSTCRNPPCIVTDPPTTNEWSRWSHWSQCSVTCDIGLMSRTRTCRAAPGQTCEGDRSEETTCRNQPCIATESPNREASAEWSSWRKWGRCSRTCGDGVHTRQRDCLDRYSRLATGQCRDGTGSEEKRTCFVQECDEVPDSSPNPSQTQQGEAVVSLSLSWVIGIVAGLSILVLLCIIIVLVRRLKKKRSVVMQTIGGSNQREREPPRRNPSVFVSEDGMSDSHAYAEIDEDKMYLKTKKSMSVVTIDNTYVTLPTSASMRSDSECGELDSGDAVGYCNVNESVFRFDGMYASTNEKSSSGLANQNAPKVTNEKKGQGRSDVRVPVDNNGYMVPVATPERKRQVKYTKKK